MSLKNFLDASTRQRLDLLKTDSVTQSDVRAYLGDMAFNELLALAQANPPHLSGTPNTLLFLPGIMGSLLYSKGLGGVWWVDVRTREQIDRLRLSPDGTTDATPTDHITPFTCDPTYIPFLKAALTDGRFGEPEHFAYDWRKFLPDSADALKDKIEKMYAENGRNPVNLVGHSMGGVMIRTCLMKHGASLQSKIGKIVFIGTPHFGAPAVGAYLKDHFWGWEMMAVLGLYMTPKTYRSMRGAIGLLPAPAEVYPGAKDGQHPCFNFDQFDAKAWAPLPDDSNNEDVTDLQTKLDVAKQFQTDLNSHHETLGWDWWDRMLCIIGVGYKTLFRMEHRNGPFGLWESMHRETGRIVGDIHREGDGRVPVASSQLTNATLRYVQGVHGGLTNIPNVYADVFRWLSGETLQLDRNPNGPLYSHLGTSSLSSDAPHLDGTAKVMGDDPGYWDETQRSGVIGHEQLQQNLDGEDANRFNQVRIL